MIDMSLKGREEEFIFDSYVYIPQKLIPNPKWTK